jgi:hypothetical protein
MSLHIQPIVDAANLSPENPVGSSRVAAVLIKLDRLAAFLLLRPQRT